MPRSLDILILMHRDDVTFVNSSFTIKILVKHWRHMGLTVGIEQGPPRFAELRAPVAVNHVARTVTPPAYIDYLRRFAAVINGGLTDISKSKYSPDLLSSPEGYDGPVILKTNLNCGGQSEKRSSDLRGIWRYLRPVLRRLRQPERRMSWSTIAYIEPDKYPVYERPSLVPAEAWTNPNLVVQKFRPERDSAGLYRLRCWYVLGDRGFNVITLAERPVVRGKDIIKRWVTDEPTPTELTALRKAMCMDYGRIDYVMLDGKPVIYDINRTPTSSLGAVTAYASQWRELAEGVVSFL